MIGVRDMNPVVVIGAEQAVAVGVKAELRVGD
jgi:hypothetical protein